jgi:hypothetical protein
MKILLWADVHAEHSVHGNNLRGEGSSSLTVDWLVAHARAERPDCVFILGDLFDEHGLIESRLAVSVRDKILSLTDLGVKIVLVTGNHEYQEVHERFFGHGLLEAIFGGREGQGVYVVDRQARIIPLGVDTALVGIPYRSTKEQFTATVIEPLLQDIDAAAGRRVVVGWHCGVPNAAAWRGDEPENAFIAVDNPEMAFLFDLAVDRRIYCGHYHGPGDTPFGDLGTFTYVGSPATRTIAESGQTKRVLIWEDGVVTAAESGLILDHIASSVEGAAAHLAAMLARHGEQVADLLRVRIRLPEGSTIDDYNVAKAGLKSLAVNHQIAVDRPETRRVGLADDIIARATHDHSYTPAMMERDILIRSILTTFGAPGLSVPPLAAVESLQDTPDGELTDALLADVLFAGSEQSPRLLGTVGRMLVLALKMARPQ